MSGREGNLERQAGAILLSVGLVVGVYQFVHPVDLGFGFGVETSAIAQNLARHGTFGNPFAPAVTGPTAVLPPFYSIFLAALLKLLSAVSAMAFAATLANIVINAIIAAVMPRLSTVLFGDPVPGVCAGVLWLCIMRLMPQWDASWTLAGLVLLVLLSYRDVTSRWSSVPAGFACGVLSLMNPASLTVSIPWLAFLLRYHRVRWKTAIRYGTTVFLAIGICNLPWLARNYYLWHTLVVRTAFGPVFYSSNNDCAESSLAKNARHGCYQRTHPVTSESEIRLLQDLGEVRYDRFRTAATLEWIRSHPARFRQLTLARIAEFWFPDPISPAYTIYGIWIVTILSFAGVIRMAIHREPFTGFTLFVWLTYPLMYYVVISCDRYRYPILWTSLMPAGYLVAALLRTLSSMFTVERSRNTGMAARLSGWSS